MVIQKICKNITGRIFFLSTVTIAINIILCFSISSFHVYLPFDAIKLMKKICNDSGSIELTTEELAEDKTYELNNIISILEEKIENSELKIFKNFIKFKIFVENNIKTQDGEIIKFNSEWIDGVYTEASPGQGKVFLTKTNLNGLRQLKLENLEYSFDSEKDPPIYIANDDENIKFHFILKHL